MVSGTVYRSKKAKGAFRKAAGMSSSKEKSKIDQLVDTANIVLYEFKSTFPFDLRPTKITICPNRITVSNAGLMSNEEYPMAIESITNAKVFSSFLFAGLSFETFGIEKPPPIRYLKKEEARTARRFILGLIECKKNGIDLLGLNKEEITSKLLQIGKVRK